MQPPELHEESLTWDAFNAALKNRFRDVRNEHFYFAQLRQAKQKKDESVQDYADRLRGLAQKIIPEGADSERKKFYQEQAEKMLLATFFFGLSASKICHTIFNQ
jgi:hypothetical protein